MDRDPSAIIESSTGLLSQEIVDEDTSRVIYAAPRDSVGQGAHIVSEEDTAMPVVSVAIVTNFFTKIRTGLLDSGLDLETDDNNDINLDLNATLSFLTRSTSSGGRIQTKLMVASDSPRGQGEAGKRKVLLD